MSTLRISSRSPELAFEPSGPPGPADIELAPLVSVIRVLLPGHDEDAIAERIGGETGGLGTTLGFDRERRLTELVLDMTPARNVTLIDARWARTIRDELARATPAVPRLDDRHTTKRWAVVERTLLSATLDLAALMFWPAAAERDSSCGLEQLDLFEVGEGVWIGAHPETRRLGAVLVDRVGERQWVQGWSTEGVPGSAAALNALHRAYYARPAFEDFRRERARLEAALPADVTADPGFVEAWRSVADLYESDLAFDERHG